jgi:DNA-binding NtrC family response regulator
MNTIDETTSAPSPSKPSRKTFNLQAAPNRHSPFTIHDSRRTSHHSTTRWAGGALIYLVDDEQGLTALYSLFLKGAGHRVRIFNCRADALAGLKADSEKPDLLITDCLGDTMPIHLFMQRCRMAHPALRILMASGLSEDEVRSYCLRPDRFLRKPFTADRFVREVSAALAA